MTSSGATTATTPRMAFCWSPDRSRPNDTARVMTADTAAVRDATDTTGSRFMTSPWVGVDVGRVSPDRQLGPLRPQPETLAGLGAEVAVRVVADPTLVGLEVADGALERLRVPRVALH